MPWLVAHGANFSYHCCPPSHSFWVRFWSQRFKCSNADKGTSVIDLPSLKGAGVPFWIQLGAYSQLGTEEGDCADPGRGQTASKLLKIYHKNHHVWGKDQKSAATFWRRPERDAAKWQVPARPWEALQFVQINGLWDLMCSLWGCLYIMSPTFRYIYEHPLIGQLVFPYTRIFLWVFWLPWTTQVNMSIEAFRVPIWRQDGTKLDGTLSPLLRWMNVMGEIGT